MIYIIFNLLSVFFVFFEKVRNYSFIVFVFVFVAFAMLSQGGSWDYAGYEIYYNCANENGCINHNVEKTFDYISKFSSIFFSDFGLYFVFFIYIACSIYIKFKIAKDYSAHFGVFLFSYAGYFLYLHEMTQIRVALAIAFCWLALVNLAKYKLNKFLIYIFVASFFHLSSLFFIVLLIFRKISNVFLLVFVFVSIPVGAYFSKHGIPAFSNLPIERINIYIAAFGADSQNIPQVNVFSLFLISVLLYSYFNSKYFNYSSLELLVQKSIAMGLIFYFLLFFVPTIPIRLLELVSAMYPLIIAKIYSTKKSFSRIIIVSFILLLWINLAVKNNTRLDFIFDWQKINIEYMNTEQLDYYMDYVK